MVLNFKNTSEETGSGDRVLIPIVRKWKIRGQVVASLEEQASVLLKKINPQVLYFIEI
jgi:hypothetical protein